MSTRLRSGSATDVGRARSINQDTPLVAEGLFAVCDGMGGHRGGEVASQVAADSLRQNFVDHTLDSLVSAVQAANESVYARAQGDPDLRGMGTTLCALALVDIDLDDPSLGAANGNGAGVDDTHGRGRRSSAEVPTGPAPAPARAGQTAAGQSSDSADEQQLGIVNVGDSRCYLFRDGDLVQITRDHSLVEEMVRDGRLRPEDALSHPQRNVLTRALGVDPFVEVDADLVVPYTGDRYLICSDGLFNEVDENRIGATLRRLDDPNEVARELVRLANEGGGRDNITVVVVDVVDDDGRAEKASSALAGDAATTRSHRDLAGFSTAVGDEVTTDAESQAAPTGRKARKAARPAKPPRGRRLTWRVALFFLVFLGVLGAAAFAVGTYARSTYYVGFSGDEVAIFKGRPGGFLWFDPTVEETTGITREQVPAARVRQIEAGRQESSLAAAQAFIVNLQDQIERFGGSTTTTTTTTTSTTTSTVPVVPSTVVAAPAGPTTIVAAGPSRAGGLAA